MKARLVLLGLLLAALPAQGAINGPQPFDADYPFMEGMNDQNLTIVSGAMEARLAHVTGAFGFFNTTGLEVVAERVCWNTTPPSCEQGNVALMVEPGGGAGLDFPSAVSGTFTAEHVLGVFVDFAGQEDLNSYQVGRSLLAPSVEGTMVFDGISDIPLQQIFNQQATGGMVPISDDTVIHVLRDGVIVQSFQGKGHAFSFEGNVSIDAFQSDFAILPFEAGSEASFDEASGEAASVGLDFSRISQMLQRLDGANQGSTADAGDVDSVTNDIQDVLDDVLNGAVLRIPAANATFEEAFAFVKFDNLDVTARTGGRLAWEGQAALQIEGDQVVGAQDLIGGKYFSLPWWSFLLWGIALAVWIARLVVKPEKEHPVWDRFKWVGWVFGVIAGIVVFILWDYEVRAVWGTSLLSTDAGGAGLLVTALIQLVPLALVMFAVAAPLRMILRNGSLLARQGTFMGLSGGVAYLAAFALGATLLLAYLELILVRVLESTGG